MWLCVGAGDARRACGDVTEGLTALTAAAQGDHYEIIQLLLRHGHVVARPHAALCDCVECVRVEKTQEVCSVEKNVEKSGKNLRCGGSIFGVGRQTRGPDVPIRC